MALQQRYLHDFIVEDLQKKMVFLGGPRQVGKTTFAVDLVYDPKDIQYYNWDKLSQKQSALKGEWGPAKLIILDEFHKYPKWKTWIKGEFDTHKGQYQFLLTGSARLDIYRRGGDSLQGRYHSYRLHPFSVAELHDKRFQGEAGKTLNFPEQKNTRNLDELFHFGGFPEPLFAQNERQWRRWEKERHDRLVREDIRDLTRVQDLGNLALLVELLPKKVASVLSINSIAQDLQINFRTASNWLDIFERLYYCFRLSPYFSKKIASVRKEKKLYLWDWSSIPSTGPRWENLVASHLLKFSHYLQDSGGYKVELFYLRDSTGREVDFLLTLDHKPWMAIEVKSDSGPVSKHLFYFQEKLKIPYCYQLSPQPNIDKMSQSVRQMSMDKFLGALV